MGLTCIWLYAYFTRITLQKWSSQSQATPESQAMNSNFREHSWKSRPFPDRQKTEEVIAAGKDTTLMFQESTRESGEHFQNSRWQSTEKQTNCPQSTNNDVKKCEFEEHSQNLS